MWLLDTNVYIRAFTHVEAEPEFRAFHQEFLPYLLLSAVVIHELMVGASTPDRRRQLEKGLVEPFRSRGRIHVPSLSIWQLAAQADVRLRAAGRYAASLRQRSFANDLLLAATARELGATLVTYNTADFERIGQVLPHKVVVPWPTLPPK